MSSLSFSLDKYFIIVWHLSLFFLGAITTVGPSYWFIDANVNTLMHRHNTTYEHDRRAYRRLTVRAWAFGAMVFIWPIVVGPALTVMLLPLMGIKL